MVKHVMHGSYRGFTLIETLVVLLIMMLLIGMTAPAYFQRLQVAKEVVLQQNLATTRSAIDKFYIDKGRYPASIDELVQRQYLSARPLDPISESAEDWVVEQAETADPTEAGIGNLRSSAAGSTTSGVPYASL